MIIRMTTQNIHPQKPIACIIMASGMGKRFGSNKLIADFLGKPLIQHMIETTNCVDFAARLVVTRHQAVEKLCKQCGVDVLLHNETSRNDVIRLGLEYLGRENYAGYMFCQGDQPLLTSDSIKKLMISFEKQPDKIHRLCYGDEAGSPVLFPSRYYEELITLPIGKGGGYLTHLYPQQVVSVPANNAHELKDIDTKEDLLQLLNIVNKIDYKSE